MAILKLIRWPNLVIVFLSMVLVLFFVIDPILGLNPFEGGLTLFDFLLLVLSTLSITVAGYLINDFFDMDADRINKPGENQVGRKFSVAYVQLTYWVLTIFGILIGVFLSWKVGQINYSLLFVFVSGLLWFYSERYQCMPVVGNVVVAFLSSLSFGMVWLFQFFALQGQPYYFSLSQGSFAFANRMVLMYMGFAFLVSLMREVIKDAEDVEGDGKYGCGNFAVKYGPGKSKILAMVLAVIGLLFSVWFQLFLFGAGFWFLFGHFFVVDALFVYIILKLSNAEGKEDFKRLSSLSKILMLVGILSMVWVYFEL